MPHYKDGSLATVGDDVHGKTDWLDIRHGTVVHIHEGATTCNAVVAHLSKLTPAGDRVIPYLCFSTVTLAELEKITT